MGLKQKAAEVAKEGAAQAKDFAVGVSEDFEDEFDKKLTKWQALKYSGALACAFGVALLAIGCAIGIALVKNGVL